uniref:Cytochrome P450 family 2 subfamily D member 6 n=1 Tax=Equus asinus asinus TaxID=83772 RepID=A0A8C4PF87_EQUAS
MGLLTGDTLWPLAVAVAIFLLLVDLMHRHQRWAPRYPPGPMPLPGLGNLLPVDFQDTVCSFTRVRKVGVDTEVLGTPRSSFPGQRGFVALHNELVTKHRVTWDPAQPARDLTDAFLDDVKKAKGNPESSFNDDNLHLVLADLFPARVVVTTSNTLAWALLLISLHPDARRPEMGDQARMPFTMAVVHEVQRFGDIAPLGLPHMTSRDIEVQGFLIPKGTTLITNLSSVLKDETIWKKPFCFHPEHFLDTQGHFVKQEAFMPFSAGACGEPGSLPLLGSLGGVEPRPPLVDHGVFGCLVTLSPYKLCAVPSVRR